MSERPEDNPERFENVFNAIAFIGFLSLSFALEPGSVVSSLAAGVAGNNLTDYIKSFPGFINNFLKDSNKDDLQGLIFSTFNESVKQWKFRILSENPEKQAMIDSFLEIFIQKASDLFLRNDLFSSNSLPVLIQSDDDEICKYIHENFQNAFKDEGVTNLLIKYIRVLIEIWSKNIREEVLGVSSESPRAWRELQYILLMNTVSEVKNNSKLLNEIISKLESLSDRELNSEIENIESKNLRINNLPPRNYEKFIGRKYELEKIKKSLRSSYPMVKIDGIGGIGKSTVALEIGYFYIENYDNLNESERFEAVVWTSAKRDYLAGDGIQSRVKEKVSQTLADIFSDILLAFKRKDLLQANLEGKVLQSEVENLLREKKTLLIIDNFETIEDPDVRSFIEEVPEPTKIMITTRYGIDATLKVRIKEMQPEDSKEIIEQEWNARGIEYPLTGEIIQNIHSFTGGVPVALKFVIAQLKYGKTLDDLEKRFNDNKNEVAEFSFSQLFEQMPDELNYILIALALINEKASKEAILNVSGLMEMDKINQGISQLMEFSLVNEDNQLYSIIPMVRRFVMNIFESFSDYIKSNLKMNYRSFEKNSKYKELKRVEKEALELYEMGELDSSEIKSYEGLDIAEKFDLKKDSLFILSNMVKISLRKGDLELAKYYLLQIIELSTKLYLHTYHLILLELRNMDLSSIYEHLYNEYFEKFSETHSDLRQCALILIARYYSSSYEEVIKDSEAFAMIHNLFKKIKYSDGLALNYYLKGISILTKAPAYSSNRDNLLEIVDSETSQEGIKFLKLSISNLSILLSNRDLFKEILRFSSWVYSEIAQNLFKDIAESEELKYLLADFKAKGNPDLHESLRELFKRSREYFELAFDMDLMMLQVPSTMEQLQLICIWSRDQLGFMKYLLFEIVISRDMDVMEQQRRDLNNLKEFYKKFVSESQKPLTIQEIYQSIDLLFGHYNLIKSSDFLAKLRNLNNTEKSFFIEFRKVDRSQLSDNIVDWAEYNLGIFPEIIGNLRDIYHSLNNDQKNNILKFLKSLES